MDRTKKFGRNAMFLVLCVLSLAFIAPVLVVLMNSFKDQFSISSDEAFHFPTGDTFVGFQNYVGGVEKTDYWNAFGCSLSITVCALAVIVLFTSMTAWYVTRVKSRYSSALYYGLIFSMVVPFQMVMFSMSKLANMLHLDNPAGLVALYLGFGAGQAVFLFSGFVKSIPVDIEEAALIDGCSPIQEFFLVVFPILKPISITVAILDAMWIWNDYLMPYLVIGSDYKTVPIAVQYLQGGYGSKDMGAMMAVLVLSIIPVVVFYLFCQKYIIRGSVAGAVKG
ncbi:MAG: carbohydrate ABC transporter permease [Oscillospiraceae bacterium]|jgi:raffinose/stachyose/melibiose transport system permease protein|nr:carbohydrate ABC transporter permease [Oscillospiraceae bacterium]